MPERILDARTRDLLKHLEIYARDVITGIRYGMHRSKRRGTSTDFLHHRGYIPGDPLKHLDWKVFGRTERYYVKTFLEDSSMTLWTVLDVSGSMMADPGVSYEGDREVELPSKFLVGARLAAALSCLVINQQDRAGLVLAGEKQAVIRPGSSQPHLTLMLHETVSVDVRGGADPADALKRVEENAGGPGIVALVTDLFYDPEAVRQRLKSLRARGHDVILFQVVSPQEADFPFNRWVEFDCAERAGVRHRLDATLLAEVYRKEYASFMEDWETFCRRQRVDLVPVRTDADLQEAINAYLRQRQMIER